MSDPITLNVGGKLYTTSLATLTSFPDSMLGAMFSGKMPTKRDSQGNCFIDRDGKVFRYILNFLRTSHLDLPEDFQEMGLLRREADFYQVQPLIEALQEKEVELSKAEKNAMLNITLKQRVQTVHFTVREAPQIYSLSSSSMEVFNANIFSTSCLFLKLLGSKLFYCSNGNLSSITSHSQDPNHLTLDWVANVEGLPEEEYTKQNLKRLWVVPANKQINSFQVFVEEVLKIALSDGFCIDSSHPHALDFMNNKIIRLIRYSVKTGLWMGACKALSSSYLEAFLFSTPWSESFITVQQNIATIIRMNYNKKYRTSAAALSESACCKKIVTVSYLEAKQTPTMNRQIAGRDQADPYNESSDCW
ncbi:hypothetical protein STEG23_028314 [Scotinomys teguina]